MTKRLFAIVGAGLFALGAQAQQGTSNATQPTQNQVVPCQTTTAPSAAPKPSNSQPTIFDRWKKKINDQSAALGRTTGLPMPTTDDLSQLANAKPAPCPPAKQVAPTTTAPKIPSDAIVSLRCNPMVPGPKGAPGAPTAFTLPDPTAFGIPAAGQFEADAVVPDASAKTPCYLIRTDPTNKKLFIAQ